VNPGGVDWVINEKGRAKVGRDGRVRVRIEGLVFAQGPNVGKNTVPQLAAIVYCGCHGHVHRGERSVGREAGPTGGGAPA
jgi:hypothetical protein